MRKKLIIFAIACFTLFIGGIGAAFLIVQSVKSQLPQLITVKDYHPLMVSQVYDRNGKKFGEFFRERRTVIPYEKIPKQLVQAFMAAEDDQFFEHHGINLQAIFRATLANIRAGRSVQGGSTITQQVAKTLMLSSEKTFTRKLKDILLAIEMEKNLSKEEILYLYLNQIYFGQGAYGIEQASQTYFKKSVKDITLAEMAILAGLPQAPSRYSPVSNPKRAKERQIYVLHRMADVKFISKEDAKKAVQEPVKVFVRENYTEYAPYFLETLRQILVAQLGEEMVLDKGLKIYTSLDLPKQLAAQKSVEDGLKSLDKRQGFRGPLKNINLEDKETFLEEERKSLVQSSTPERIILPTGVFADINTGKKIGNLPAYYKINDVIKGVVTQIDDNAGLVFIDVPESQGLIDLSTMQWARKPDPNITPDRALVSKPSEALKVGDVILVKVAATQFASERLASPKKKKNAPEVKLPDFKKYLALELDQDPIAEASLLSLDQQSNDIIAMIGGLNFAKSEFNRAIQAPRQTGSSFKALVYAAALDKEYTPSTPIMNAPLVYHETIKDEGQEEVRTWKPANHSKSFGGDIIFRNALVQSLNIPTVKIIEDIGVPWAMDYSKRLGIFSPLNPDFTLALGSSGVTLYEMTKAFAHFASLGKRIKPLMIHKVLDKDAKQIMGKVSLDIRFEKEIKAVEDSFEEKKSKWLEKKAALAAKEADTAQGAEVAPNPKKKISIEERFFFEDPDQLIRPQTAYVMTSILKGVVEDPNGTGGRARALGREVAGKTGSSNNYFDAWFIGYTPQITTGVWVGFDTEKTLGRGEVGGRAALPIWVEYMKAAHENLPQMTFPVPQGIVFTKIDLETGKPAGPASKKTLEQAYIEGTEPTAAAYRDEEEKDFLKEDLEE